MAALSFDYAPPISNQYLNYTQDFNVTDLEKKCQTISTNRDCQILINTSQTNQVNLCLIGNVQSLLNARGDLLSTCPLKVKVKIEILPTFKKSQLCNELKKLESEFDIKINVISEKSNYSSLVSDNPISIEIMGTPIQVEQVRVRVLVLFDEIVKNFTTEIVKLPLKLQYLICGRKRVGLLPIIEETASNIYFPSPFNNIRLDQDIYITGELIHVSRVKDMLNKLAIQKEKSMYHKEISLDARKIDWLLLHRRDELRKIMHDNGAFIEFPRIGSGHTRVAVYAENRVNAERTLRALNLQTCQIYEACFFFNPPDLFDSIPTLVSELSQISNSEVLFKSDSIEVLGSERAIRNVYQRLQEMQFIQIYHQLTLFRVESSNEQRDFISGKKNGKINKIMKTSGAKIKFSPFMNDYNFLIEVESTSFTKALDGLTLLQEELPAEISFYVPECYHKRIIGVGGKNIQRIMKKYGVYVKFSNTEEFASLGGYFNNQDNVVARTPMKNQINLDNLRHAVMELIHPKDRDYVEEELSVPFEIQTELIHTHQAHFEEVLKKTNTQLAWPDAELARSCLTLLGPEAHLPIAINLIESVLPERFMLYLDHEVNSRRLIELGCQVEGNLVQWVQTRAGMKDMLKNVLDCLGELAPPGLMASIEKKQRKKKKVDFVKPAPQPSVYHPSVLNQTIFQLNDLHLDRGWQHSNIRAIFDGPEYVPFSNDIWSTRNFRNRNNRPFGTTQPTYDKGFKEGPLFYPNQTTTTNEFNPYDTPEFNLIHSFQPTPNYPSNGYPYPTEPNFFEDNQIQSMLDSFPYDQKDKEDTLRK